MIEKEFLGDPSSQTENAADPAELRTPGRFSGGGSWTSLRGGWPGLDERLQDAVKMHFTVKVDPESEEPLNQEVLYDQNVVLLDFRGFPASAIDRGKTMVDIELIREALENHWDFFIEALTEMNKPVPEEEQVARIAAKAEELGLTEKAFAEKGGGIWPLVGFAAAAFLMYGGCSACRGAQRKPNKDVRPDYD